ncbi:gamma-glutamyl phosphate reductase, putative [Eimeria necatrix]|uniref:glutamate-5-semialdehyde dehydrogenase n=1 Tax=Eimeria necatrix TaxID=51315 RepID=U6ML95_9EIME|nr:gamma-glutamyl phosphate reductase, putative [Eimeria necatrix]CDJ65012.1 gamma-glutamyl phosphate reductase, putative [Eimeria necatrix]
MTADSSLVALEKRIREAKAVASRLSPKTRDKVLGAFKEGLLLHNAKILQANRADVEEATNSGTVAPALLKRLVLDARKLESLAAAIDALRAAPNPLGKCTLATELTPGLNLYRVTVPLGALLIIFEGRPEAFVQIASLGLKSGNVCLLKGGKEAARTNKALHDAFVFGIQSKFSVDEAGVSGGPEEDQRSLCSLVQLVESREDVQQLLQLDGCIDLVIPRGGTNLVRFVKSHTAIPVMGHADGICHAYIDADAVCTPQRLQKALDVIRDSKLQYVAACNALEVLLVHKDAAEVLLPTLGQALAAEGVQFRADEAAARLLPQSVTKAAVPQDFCTEWLAPILSVKVLEDLDEALNCINTNGSHHTDVIISYCPSNVEKFMRGVASADVFCNCSTRFADGFRFGFNAEVGIATGKTHARGPVGVDGLCTYAYRLYGMGHTVSAVEAEAAFSHKPLLVLDQANKSDVRMNTEEAIDAYERSRIFLQ